MSLTMGLILVGLVHTLTKNERTGITRKDFHTSTLMPRPCVPPYKKWFGVPRQILLTLLHEYSKDQQA